MNERCWTLLGSRDASSGTWRIELHHIVLGDQTRVEADWSWTLAREEADGDVMGFYHTHPQGIGTQPSKRDIRTMQAWCSALGKPLLCLIAEDPGARIPTGYVFESDEHRGLSVGAPTQGEGGVYIFEELQPETEET
jgi:proteasome lid subunit RPN8/RPN11